MLRKFYATLAVFSLTLMSVNFAFGKQTGSWDEVKKFVNSGVVIKHNKKTIYGIIRSVDDTGLKIQLARDKDFDPNETHIPRDEIQKIWRGEIFANIRPFGTGIVVGGAVGAVALGIPAVTSKGEKDGLEPLAFLVGAVIGGVVGGVIGSLIKKKHKRGELIYSR